VRTFLSQIDASEWLKDGKILIHPTEGIWGIGCDALNKDSIARVYELKQRPLDKSLIILCKNINDMTDFIAPINEKDMAFLNSMADKAITVLYEYNLNTTPVHLQNKTGKLAIRVSAHYHIKSLLKVFNGPIISTSANISGASMHPDISQIQNDFDYDDVAFFDKPLGNLNQATPIIDLNSREAVRP
jgi:L-threonylcarbamoyladenylate synthase